MTQARSVQLAISDSNFFHCYSRCVRQNFLCGVDEYSGANYEHRKEWIVNRIEYLSQVFAVQVWGYAVMSNHYHLVLEVNASEAEGWEEEELLYRWGLVFPSDAKKAMSLSREMLDERLEVIREHLGSLSKFMYCLNHYIAVSANKEEDKKGRFWDSRFKLKALHDESAVLTAMAYVDLNPVRAKVAMTPESSEYTSIQKRIEGSRACELDKVIKPVCVSEYFDYKESKLGISLRDYIELVEMTGRCLLQGKGAIPKSLPAIFERLSISVSGWIEVIEHFNTSTGYVVCHPESLDELPRMKGRRILRALSG